MKFKDYLDKVGDSLEKKKRSLKKWSIQKRKSVRKDSRRMRMRHKASGKIGTGRFVRRKTSIKRRRV